TDKGQKPIKDIKAGEYVLTSEGYKPVVKKWNNGTKQIKEYRMQCGTLFVSLKCTEDHLIKTDKGWKPIKDLKPGMSLFLTKSLTECDTTCIQEQNTMPVIKSGSILPYG